MRNSVPDFLTFLLKLHGAADFMLANNEHIFSVSALECKKED
jgi:hypothetical protein